MKTLISLLSLLFIFQLVHSQEDEVLLNKLMFSENWFNDLEEAKANPDEALYLDLSLQKLRSFPPAILTLKNLERLYLPYNYWPSIPDEIGTLENLKVLDISGNYYMSRLPEGLADLNLEQLVIKDHKLVNGEIDKAQQWLPNCKIVTD